MVFPLFPIGDHRGAGAVGVAHAQRAAVRRLEHGGRGRRLVVDQDDGLERAALLRADAFRGVHPPREDGVEPLPDDRLVEEGDLVSARGLLEGSAKSLRLIETCDEDRPFAVQIFGGEPQAFYVPIISDPVTTRSMFVGPTVPFS